MKVKILSDLHLDINSNTPLSLPDTDVFTIICGDISGHMSDTVNWINQNAKQGVFVEGNHIGYNNKKHSIQYLQTELQKQFPIDSDISYLYDDYKVIGDYVFVGGILWTNYMLTGEPYVYYHKQIALQYMNDFKYNYYNILGNVNKENGLTVKKLSPTNCETMFYKTKGIIREACEKFPDKKIIVITHHAPSEKSISVEYSTHKATASYASNLENFILDHPNIKLWCHGHIHSPSDYMIGDCRVICNPRGYEKYSENKNFNSHLVIDI